MRRWDSKPPMKNPKFLDLPPISPPPRYILGSVSHSSFSHGTVDNIIGSVELVKDGDCDTVIGAYESLGNAARLASWEPVSPQNPRTVAYQLRAPSAGNTNLKSSVISLTLQEGRCSLTYGFTRN